MSKSKYIIIGGEHVPEYAVIFPCFINHSDMVQGNQKVVSAGMCEVYAEGRYTKVWAGGESETLGIKSRSSDAALICRMISADVDL